MVLITYEAMLLLRILAGVPGVARVNKVTISQKTL